VERGATLFARSPVREVATSRVTLDRGTIHCERVIVAVDGRLESLLPELSGRVRTARLQMLATAPTSERIVPCPMYYREGYEYWQGLPNGSIAIGGFRDKAGESEWSLDARPTEPVQTMLETFVREHLGVHAPITYRWAACAGYSDNGLPVLEETRDGVWALGGYSGTGNVIGALCGRAVVALAVDDDASLARALVQSPLRRLAALS
ncbi:MAG TPA: FAD-dependent oxidoreductase, partial [Gemmatimonas sp.]|nr:FAD-dependent oxidoreductase [Gemmatimonas sp.]